MNNITAANQDTKLENILLEEDVRKLKETKPKISSYRTFTEKYVWGD